MKKITLGAVLVLSVVTTVMLGSRSMGGRDSGLVNFRTVVQSETGGVENNFNLVVRDNGRWANLWNEIHSNQSPIPAVPVIDFESKMVIAAFQGDKPTSGHSIEVGKIIKAGKKLIVSITENSPAPKCVVAQILTHPYHLVELPKFDGEIDYQEQPGLNTCK